MTVGDPSSPDQPAKLPITARLLLQETLTARRAAGIIAAFTVAITIAGGVLERVVDHREFHTIGKGLWFALQTVTTVGYGDVTPKYRDGRIIGGGSGAAPHRAQRTFGENRGGAARRPAGKVV